MWYNGGLFLGLIRIIVNFVNKKLKKVGVGDFLFEDKFISLLHE